MSIPERYSMSDVRRLLQEHYEQPTVPSPLSEHGKPQTVTELPLLNKQFAMASAEKDRIILWHESSILIPGIREVLIYNIETTSRSDEFRRQVRDLSFGSMKSIDEFTNAFFDTDVRDHLTRFYGKRMNGTGSYSVWWL